MLESFSQKMHGRVTNATDWAKGLKIRRAALNLISVPIWGVGWLLGFLFFCIKFVVGLFIIGIREGWGK